MAAGGVPEDVLKAFIDNSSSTFNLNSDAIIHLQSSGISGAVISEMLAHDKVLRDRAIALSTEQQQQQQQAMQSAQNGSYGQATAPNYATAGGSQAGYDYNSTPYYSGSYPAYYSYGGYYGAPYYSYSCWPSYVSFYSCGWGWRSRCAFPAGCYPYRFRTGFGTGFHGGGVHVGFGGGGFHTTVGFHTAGFHR